MMAGINVINNPIRENFKIDKNNKNTYPISKIKDIIETIVAGNNNFIFNFRTSKTDAQFISKFQTLKTFTKNTSWQNVCVYIKNSSTKITKKLYSIYKKVGDDLFSLLKNNIKFNQIYTLYCTTSTTNIVLQVLQKRGGLDD